MFDGDNGNQTVSNILTVKILILVLQDAKLSSVLVHNTGQCGFKACYKCTAVHDIDAVAVWIDLLGKAVGILKCNLNLDIAAGAFNIDRSRMKRDRFPVNVADKALDTKLFLICNGFIVIFIFVDQLEIFIKEGNLL